MNAIVQSAKKMMSSVGLNANTASTIKQSRFNRTKLPSPEAFWNSQGVTFKSKKGWVMVKCIFHDDSHPSLGINTKTGGFFCHACGAKGGDVVSAYQLLAGCNFVTAAKALSAWEK